MQTTHEEYIHAVAALAIAMLPAGQQEALRAVKLVYGSGPQGTRGVTFYQRWKTGNGDGAVPFVEISAFGQESWVQVAGTVIHELGHVLAGWNAGHGPEWKSACEALGLRKIKAAGTCYRLANFDPLLRSRIAALPRPSDGEPVSSIMGQLPPGTPNWTVKGCKAGFGTRGGKSRGVGSGSRLRLWQCGCGCKARVASDTFEAVHTPCGTPFAMR